MQTTADQVVVTGTPTRQLFRGASATTLLPGLLEALDGRRGHRRAGADASGSARARCFKALSLLWACGVVEEAAPEDVDLPDVPAAVADLLSRLGRLHGSQRGLGARRAAAGELTVEVAGDPALAAAVADELEAAAAVSVRERGRRRRATGTTLVLLAHGDVAGRAGQRSLLDRR